MNNFCEINYIFPNDLKLVLEIAMDMANCGIVAVSSAANNPFVVWNQGAIDLLGKERVELPPQDWAKYYGLYKDEDCQTMYDSQELPLVLALNNKGATDIQIFVSNENKVKGTWISVTALPIIKNNEILGGISVFKDITLLKNQQKSILKMSDQIKSLQKSIITNINGI